MKVSYQWLRELVEFEASPRDLANDLTMAGLAVDSFHQVQSDYILDFDLTSNRPDALSHLGIAREIAALYRAPLKPIVTDVNEIDRQAANETSVEIRDPDLCPRYVARLIVDVRVGPSPQWLAERLERLGQRSINNVADVTNWVLLEMGQPLHAFDWDRLSERRIVVRRARAEERIRTLDGVERTLDDSMLVIADARAPVALAGIMGGADSEISLRTRNVLLESAYFLPRSIRKTARALNLTTEASHRFERGADIEMTSRAASRAARLISEVAAGKVLQGSVDVFPGKPERARVRLTKTRLDRLLGFDLAIQEAAEILHSLQFQVEVLSPAELVATAPSYRMDIACEEDLVEEVGRVAGYDRIPTMLPEWSGYGDFPRDHERRQGIRQLLNSRGFDEAINFSFVNEALDEAFSAPGTQALRLQNPIDETRSILRQSLLSGLVESLGNNLHRGQKSLRLFELGKCFSQDSGDRSVLETEGLGLIATGFEDERNWRSPRNPYDFFHLKGLIESLFEVLHLPMLPSRMASASFLHPVRSLEWFAENRWLARIGQLHPAAAAALKFKHPVLIGEVRLGELLNRPESPTRCRPLPKYPAVVRDVSFLIDRDQPYAAVAAAIGELRIQALRELRLFDLFTGGQLPPSKRSMSISLRLLADDHTLREEEIERIRSEIVGLLQSRFGVVVRQ